MQPPRPSGTEEPGASRLSHSPVRFASAEAACDAVVRTPEPRSSSPLERQPEGTEPLAKTSARVRTPLLTRRRDATSGEGQERRGQRLDPAVRGGEAPKARPATPRAHAGRARALDRAEPVDRSEPGGRGDDLDERADAARPRG